MWLSEVESCKCVGTVICVFVNTLRFASCPYNEKKVIASYRQGAASAPSLVCLSVYVCLTLLLPVTICFSLPQGELGWDYTTQYWLLQVTWQTFCLVFSCHICPVPFMWDQTACLQTVQLPALVSSMWETTSVPQIHSLAKREGPSLGPYTTTLAADFLAVLLHQTWQCSFSTPRQTQCTADRWCSSIALWLWLLASVCLDGISISPCLHCIGIQEALRARTFLCSVNTTPTVLVHFQELSKGMS